MRKYLQFKHAIPRWIIILLDFFIVAFSFSCSYFMVYHFQFTEILRGYFFIYTYLYCAVAVLVMYSMRIHKGLIRYSNTRDMVRIFISAFVSSVIYLFLVRFWVIPVLHINIHIHTIEIILLANFSVSSTLLIMMRTTAKGMYFYIKNNHDDDRTVVLIYGSDHNAVLVKQALESSEKSNFTIAGFLDNDVNKVNREIEQKRVYSTDSLEKLKIKYNIEKLIVMNQQLEDPDKKLIVEKCLAMGIQVLTVPPSDQWIYGKLNLRQIQDLKIEDLLQRKPIQIDTTKIAGDVKDKRVLITGAAGSIGSEIVRQVLEYGPAMVILCDQAESPLHEIKLDVEEKYPQMDIRIFIADVRNHQRMHKLFIDFRPQIVFHAAAYKHVPMMEENPTEAVLTNILGTKHVADLSIAYKVHKFVMISTDKAVNPSNIMGTTKRIAEIYIQSLKNSPQNDCTRFITTRFGNVLGSNGSVIPRFKSQIQKNGPITVTHPEITRYFMTIPEAVQLVLEAGTMGEGGEIFIFDMGQPVKIIDLAIKMIKLAGLRPEEDIKIVYTGLRPGEKLYEELLNQGEITLPTHHEKIKIAKVITYPYEQVAADIQELLILNKYNNEIDIVNKMKEIVPEFISMNSQFEQLDDKRGDGVYHEVLEAEEH